MSPGANSINRLSSRLNQRLPMPPKDEEVLKKTIIAKLTTNQPWIFTSKDEMYKSYILNRVYDEIQYSSRLLKNFKMLYPVFGGKSRKSRKSRRSQTRRY